MQFSVRAGPPPPPSPRGFTRARVVTRCAVALVLLERVVDALLAKARKSHVDLRERECY